MADDWREQVLRWRELTASTGPGPDPSEEYYIYQTLVGAWPITRIDSSLDDEGNSEAKRNTSWVERNGEWRNPSRPSAGDLRQRDPPPDDRRLRRPRRARRRATLPRPVVLKLTSPGCRHLPGRRALVASTRRPRQPPAGRLPRSAARRLPRSSQAFPPRERRGSST